MSFAVSVPYPVFTDRNGDPIDDGYVYIGVANQNPQTNPITVYWDAALTIPASQPLRTSGGYLYRNGSPANVYTSASFSTVVRDREGELVYTFPELSGVESAANLANTSNVALGDALIGFRQSNSSGLYSGSVGRTVHQKLQEVVSVLDFTGADPTGATDSSTAFANALATGKLVFVPKGTYQVQVDIPTKGEIVGEGIDVTILIPPTAASYVLRLNATAIAKQWCRIGELSIQNTGAVANCIGIKFQGTDVNTINDMHNLSRIRIRDLDIGVDITGRLIGTHWEHVEVLACRIGFKAVTDPVSVAFIFNQFESCLFNDCEAEGMRIEDVNLSNAFYTCNWQGNNSDQVAGVAAFYIESCRQIIMENGHFESNGSSVAVDTLTPSNNAMDMRISGTSIVQRISIKNSLFAGANGMSLYIDAIPMYGGEIDNNSFAPKALGWAFVVNSQLLADTEPLKVSASNIFGGVVKVEGADQQYPVGFDQNTTMKYYSASGTPPTIDLLEYCRFSINNQNATMAIVAVSNRLPGCELFIWNSVGSGDVTIAGALMADGALETIAAGTTARFIVASFPQIGKFVPA